MTGPITRRIEDKLTHRLHPIHLEVVDQSLRHAGHAGARPGGQSHFELTIVADAFAGMSRLERQRLVYAILAEEIAEGVHALSMTTLTPDGT